MCGMRGSIKRRKGRDRSQSLFSTWLHYPSRLLGLLPRSYIWFSALTLFLVLSWFVIDWMVGKAMALKTYRIDPTCVRCTERPRWLDMSSPAAGDVLAGIRKALERVGSRSIFDEELIPLTEKAILDECPWVESVVATERAYPSQLKIKVRLRKPAAFFYRRGRKYGVDSDGVVITSRPVSGSGAEAQQKKRVNQNLPVIRGFDLTPSPRMGEVFPAGALIEGAAVADEIHLFDTVFGIEQGDGGSLITIGTIDVSGYGRGQPDDVILLTDQGVRLLWGRSARHFRYDGIDPTPEEKANQLRKVCEIHPGLVGLSEVTLTFDSPSYRLKQGSISND